MTETADGIEDTIEDLQDNKGVRAFVRGGFVSSGVVHIILGLLAIRVALHQQVESDQSGALTELGRLPGGLVLLWLLVATMTALGLWLGVGAVLLLRHARRKTAALKPAAKAIVYLIVAISAAVVAVGLPSNAVRSSKRAVHDVMRLPGGNLMVCALGVIVAAVGAYFIIKGVRRRFLRDLRPLPRRVRLLISVAAVVGYVGKGIAIAVTGLTFFEAGLQHRPARAGGLDSGFRALLDIPFGTDALVLIAAGFIAYGIYSVCRAPLSDLRADTRG